MNKCESCGNEISPKAKACPNCGHPNKKKTGIFKWMIGIVVFAAIASAIIRATDNTGQYTKKARAVKSQFHPWDGSHIAVEKLIKKQMNDPGSYEHIETKHSAQGGQIIVYTKFRGKNAFGATIVNTATAIVSKDGKVLDLKFNN